jgi:glycosyltransferase involved in cell wall biosynthesis
MLSDLPGIGRDSAVTVAPIDIGPKLSLRSYATLAARWPRLVRVLRSALEAQAPYDVLLIHYKKEQLLARWLPEELRATLVWAEWGPVPFPMRRGIPRRMYLRAARDARLVLAVSAGTKSSVEDVGVPADKVVVLPNALRTDDIDFTASGRARVRDRLGIPADAFVVGLISRFHPKKRNDVVVDAVRALDDDRVHLVMAGSGETGGALRTLAAPLGARAHFVDTPRGDVADVLSAFDVSVFCPSPTEGAPRATILGMLARRPVLSTGREGVHDMIAPQFGAISDPENDPAALAAILRTYLADPGLAARHGEAARAYAEATYAAPVVAAELERLLAEASR